MRLDCVGLKHSCYQNLSVDDFKSLQVLTSFLVRRILLLYCTSESMLNKCKSLLADKNWYCLGYGAINRIIMFLIFTAVTFVFSLAMH